MNYHLHQSAGNAGVFPLAELHRRRVDGQLTGGEYVWCVGMSSWQPLDTVLQQQGLAGTNPGTVPMTVSLQVPSSGYPVKWIVIGCLSAAAIVFIVLAYLVETFPPKNSQMFPSRASIAPATQPVVKQRNPTALIAASQPIEWNTNTLTAADRRKKVQEFRSRQWLEAYQKFGRHYAACDAEAVQFLNAWFERGRDDASGNDPATSILGDRLAAQPGCTDPLLLTICGVTSTDRRAAAQRLEHAVAGFQDSSYPAYPKLNACVMLEGFLNGNPARMPVLDATALQYLKEMFQDGSLQPEDQAEVAEIFLSGWGADFFRRHPAEVCEVANAAGDPYRWLALVLDGERQIDQAWAARATNSVSTGSGQNQKDFKAHLSHARGFLMSAWKLHPEWPQAADRMINVSLGDSGITEMRVWFDRCVAAQLDYTRAWTDFRLGLSPRWYGDTNAMLAFGVTALNTARFDTDVPRKFYETLQDIERAENLPPGRHIFAQAGVWPNLQKMCEGYLAEPSAAPTREGWHSTYAALAYLSGKNDVARAQLEAVDWQPQATSLSGWGWDLSLMPLRVAAFTSPASNEFELAENSKLRKSTGKSGLTLYTELLAESYAKNLDARTIKFIEARIAQLKVEHQLAAHNWTNFLPLEDTDRNWIFLRAKTHQVTDGGLEIGSGPDGHFAFSRARPTLNFEVQGDFEVVSTSNGSFQGGLIFGVPDLDDTPWYSFRIIRDIDKHDTVRFATGWGNYEISQPVTLSADFNTFYFKYDQYRVTASVNGQEVFHQVWPSNIMFIPAARFDLGVGASNDLNDSVIRYHLQVRSLVDSKATNSALDGRP